jgi:histidinol-phosphatase
LRAHCENGKKLTVSSVSTLESAALSSGNMRSFATSARWARYGRLVARVDRIRGYGDFLHYHSPAAVLEALA